MVTSAGTTSYAYNAADKLASVTPPGSGATSYSFDGDGNQTAHGADSFSWDMYNHLASATVRGQQSSFIYDGDGLRVRRTAVEVTTSMTRCLPDDVDAPTRPACELA